MTASVAARVMTTRTERYQPALDGLRAFAVVGALLFHAKMLRGGFLGVDLFFVLSGYLITGLLLTERLATGTISLTGFYTRRFRRLAPALMLVLAATALWCYTIAPSSLAPQAARQTAWSLVYANNWYALFGKVGYWGAGSTPLPLNHLWSLAIEEQFYVVWPLLLLVVARTGWGLRRLGWLAAGLALASGVWQWVAADRYGADRAYLGSDTRFVSIAIGATIAVVMTQTARRHTGTHAAAPAPARSARFGRASTRWGIAFVAGVAFLAWSWQAADLANVALYHGWLVACSAAAGVLIAAAATNPASWYASALSLQPLVWLGKRSYSIYLWHWPIWTVFSAASMKNSGAELWAVRLGLTLLISAVSYEVLELPIRNSGLSGRRLLVSIGPIACGLGALVLISPPLLPDSLGRDRVVLGTQDQHAAVSDPAGGGRGLRILVAGDSWGRNMGYALALADPSHHNAIIDLGVPGCGLLTPKSTGCPAQAESWRRAKRDDHPDAALLVEGTFDQGIAVQAHGAGAVCAADYSKRYAAALHTAISTLRGTDHLPVFVTNARDSLIGDAKSADCMNKLIASAAKRDGARLFDLHQVLCPAGGCVTTHNGLAVYDETQHLAPGGQRWVGGLVLAAIRKGVPAGTPAAPAPAGRCTAAAKTQRPAAIASYTVHPLAPYLDSSRHDKLIDRVRGKPSFADPAWLGWRTITTDIVLRLAAPAAVCTVSSDWLQELGGAVVVPPTIDVYVSGVAGKLGQHLGSAHAPPIDVSPQHSMITVRGSEPLSGQYVTVRVTTFGSWTMVDEVAVATPPGG